MPTVFSHALSAVALASALPRSSRTRVALVSAMRAALPDTDVIGFGFGIRYGDLLGHRGFSHWLVFLADRLGRVRLRQRLGGAVE